MLAAGDLDVVVTGELTDRLVTISMYRSNRRGMWRADRRRACCLRADLEVAHCELET